MLNIRIGGRDVKIDPDRLTPTARALAEAIAAHRARAAVDIWMEADSPISETTPHWEVWFTPAEAAEPERRPWRGWSTVPLGPAEDPHARLEYEATKIPVGWHVYGPHPDRPLPDRGPMHLVTTAQIIAWLGRQGRHIGPATWRSYVGKGQAPAPAEKVGRTPLWRMDDVRRWHEKGQ
jgi:hypothetical protein